MFTVVGFVMVFAIFAAASARNPQFFSVEQVVTNVNSADFSSQPEAFKTVISLAVQSVLQEFNVTADDVHRISINDKKLKWLAAPENDVVDDEEGDDGSGRRLQFSTSTWATVLSYDVTTWAYLGEFADLAAAVEAASVPNGDLQLAIQTAATAANNEELVNIELTDQIRVYNRMHPNHESERLTGAQITMLILGIFSFIVLLGVVIAFSKQNQIPLSPPSPFARPSSPYREP